MNVLAGDIGGTKSELAIYDAEQLKLKPTSAPLFGMRFLNREQSGFLAMLLSFLNQAQIPIDSACFAVAGAVRDGHCRMPNLSWDIDEQEIRAHLAINRVVLINDLAATAHGMLVLPADQLKVINVGNPLANGNYALIAAGTGLGEAIIFASRNGEYHVSASEGGHVDYAPNTESDIALLHFLMPKFDHVSWERVVSGYGLINIYAFLLASGHYFEPPTVTESIQAASDHAAAITQAAKSGESPLCIEALDIFIRNYGAAAGNLALKALATGGLYIGGGIAPKLAEHLIKGVFMQAFTHKGRFSEWMKNIPVKIILEPKTALIGAAIYSIS
ncbi:MAG: glucokinase [Betaproteobacteria bacterium HGW-Betaproteobacteria-22]|nr:MAG: glucokinase [Betaproteobacteria bacterium HGW-Betaproteobacteria-22]